VVPSAYLRVFQPLSAFPAAERPVWERYLVAGARERVPAFAYRRPSPARFGVLAPLEEEHADVRMVGAEVYLCPWRTRLRTLAGLLAARESAPPELAEALVSRSATRRAARELARIRRRDPRAVPFLMQSPWHAPIRWFVLFDDDERRLGQRENGSWRLSYLTTVPKALARAERAVPVLERSELGAIGELLTELAQWLLLFDRRSLLELDYDGLCDLLTWDELDDDHSARDIQEALAALARREFPRSADLYQGVLGRWNEVRNREVMN
jgi:hypothetical protein